MYRAHATGRTAVSIIMSRADCCRRTGAATCVTRLAISASDPLWPVANDREPKARCVEPSRSDLQAPLRHATERCVHGGQRRETASDIAPIFRRLCPPYDAARLPPQLVGSRPLALNTGAASGEVRNLISVLAASCSL